MKFHSIVALVVAAFFLCTSRVEAGPWDGVTNILQNHIKDKSFPGCVAMVANEKGILYAQPLGNFTYGLKAPHSKGNPPMTLETWFDMASVTKVLVATSAVAQFYQRGELDLDTKISDPYLLGSAFANNGKTDITVRNLLLHNSGFPPDPDPNYWNVPFGCPETSKHFPEENFSCYSKIYQGLMVQTLQNPIGAVYVYSDLSMITLAYVIGHLSYKLGYVHPTDLIPHCPSSGPSSYPCYFEAYVRKYLFEHLHMKHSHFRLPVEHWKDAAPAWNDTVYRHQVIQGTVSDGNAYAMGGISGHAGLFTNIMDVHTLLHYIMFPGPNPRFLNSTTVETFTTVYNLTQSSRALGWDTNDYKMNADRTCGSLSPKTYFHLGYTGTQVCNDPERKMFTILLTNRVYPVTGNTQISQARKDFNNAVQKVYDSLYPREQQ